MDTAYRPRALLTLLTSRRVALAKAVTRRANAVAQCDRRAYKGACPRQDVSDLHLETLASLQGTRETGQEFGNAPQILEAHQFDRRVHVTVGQGNQRAGNAAAGP